MITLINATNRPDNQTQLVAKAYKDLLEARGLEVQYFSMEQLPFNYLKLDVEKSAEEKNKKIEKKHRNCKFKISQAHHALT